VTELTLDSDTSARAVLAAIADLGEATAASIAESCGVAYSTTNMKLRLLEGAGLAEASRGGDTKVRWRLTDTGRPTAGRATQDTSRPAPHTADPGGRQAHVAGADDPVPTGGDPAGGSVAGTPRRRKGALHREVLSVLRQDPDAIFTVTQLRQKVDAARHGGGQAAASAGAVYNALLKAVADGVASHVADKPATFQAVQPTPDMTHPR
jgi:DNA-binding transcriptional ArsR family regulator